VKRKSRPQTNLVAKAIDGMKISRPLWLCQFKSGPGHSKSD